MHLKRSPMTSLSWQWLSIKQYGKERLEEGCGFHCALLYMIIKWEDFLQLADKMFLKYVVRVIAFNVNERDCLMWCRDWWKCIERSDDNYYFWILSIVYCRVCNVTHIAYCFSCFSYYYSDCAVLKCVLSHVTSSWYAQLTVLMFF